MKTVEEYYDELALKVTLQKVEEEEISDYTINLYNATQTQFPHDMVDVSLEKFAAYTANWNPGKARIGEKAQIRFLEKKFPNIIPLSGNGKGSLVLWANFDGSLSVKEGETSNIEGIKSIDAISEEKDKVVLFVLKAVDLGSFTTNKGGGHQKNVLNEIVRFISVVGGKTLLYKSKKVEILIVVDGRSAPSIIGHCKPLLQGATNMSISDSENL